MITTRLERPWLIADLGHRRRILSFAPWRAGFTEARHIVWREVRNADLTEDFDVTSWFGAELGRQGMTGAVGLLTSRDVSAFELHEARSGGVRAACLATVGLGNAERAGHRLHRIPDSYGTINLAVLIEAGLTDTALIEALTIATEARTTAILDIGLMTPAGPATGTGTDCIAIAADTGATGYAGLHTAIGEATGRAVYRAVHQAAALWMDQNGGQLPPPSALND